MSPIHMDRVESAVRVVVAYYEAFNRHDIPGMLNLISDDFTYECAFPSPEGRIYHGKDAVSSFWQDFFAHSPHIHIRVEETLGYGLRCIVRVTYASVEQPGSLGHLRGIDLFHVQDGLITELLSYVKG